MNLEFSETNRNVFLNYVRDLIERYAKENSAGFLGKNGDLKIAPSNDREVEVLKKIKEIDGFSEILEQWLAAHGYDLFFDLFCVIDGVSGPDQRIGKLKSIILIDRPDDFEEDITFLHDELF